MVGRLYNGGDDHNKDPIQRRRLYPFVTLTIYSLDTNL